jgi:hypothetical protein
MKGDTMSQKHKHENPFPHVVGKKTILLSVSLLLAFSLLAGGCSGTATPAAAAMPIDASATSGDSGNTTNEGTAQADTTGNTADIGSTSGIPTAPDRTAEYYGIVRRVIGNEITLKLVAPAETPDVQLTEAEKAAKKAERQAMSPEERQALKDAQIVMTGEEVRILVPVGSPITSGGNGTGLEGGESVLTERALADIREGMFLKIWTVEGGGGEDIVAAYTRVLQAPQ